VNYNESLVLYSISVKNLGLTLGNDSVELFPNALANGRANYLIFEELVRRYANLKPAKGSDHQDDKGRKYEQKSYQDQSLYPRSADLFRCSASSTFAANNNGPKIKAFLSDGDYESALALCKSTGYDKNSFYIFTNSGGFKPDSDFKYFILPTSTLLSHIDSKDPRMVSRAGLLSLIESEVKII
jgi:hypothetical protein